jgi:hypothetical protein
VPAEDLMPTPELAPSDSNEIPLPPQDPTSAKSTDERSALRFPFSIGKSDDNATTAK